MNLAKSLQSFCFILALSAPLIADATAVTIVGAQDKTLFIFDSSTPGTVTTLPVNVGAPSTTLIALDFRPATGEAYALDSFGQINRLDTSTGNATATGATSGGGFGNAGFDFDPALDRIRVVTQTGRNLRIDPDTGATVEDTPLNPPGSVVAIAYDHNYAGAPSEATRLYGIDAASGRLVRIDPPNAGTIVDVGSLGVGLNLNPRIGFDIAPDGAVFASIVGPDSLNRLYSIDLTTGVATSLGVIGDGNNAFTSLSVQLGGRFSAGGEILVPGQVGATTGPANPYPSTINVSGLPAQVSRIAVNLPGIRHPFPDDLDLLLVGPQGQKMLILSDVGGSISTCGPSCDNGSNGGSANVAVTLADSGATNLPDSGGLTSGTFKPTNFGANDTFAAPAPTGPYFDPAEGATFASVFNGTDPNGTWSLYVMDDGSGASGRVGVWSLTIATTPVTKLANIATRLRVESGDNVLIGGFIVTGTAPKKLIVRAIGPSLPLDGKLADPQLGIYSGNTLIAANNNWKDTNQQEIAATKLQPSNDLESAAVVTLNPGAYTAIVSDVNGGTGVGLVEVYDLEPLGQARLANISTRGLVQTGDNVMIGGFILRGAAPQKLIVRAIGPSLPVEGKLANPQLALFNGNGDQIAANDNWRSDQEGDIAATGVPPADDLEAAVVRTLDPGAYTAIVSGVDDTTGVGLVEVYALD